MTEKDEYWICVFRLSHTNDMEGTFEIELYGRVGGNDTSASVHQYHEVRVCG